MNLENKRNKIAIEAYKLFNSFKSIFNFCMNKRHELFYDTSIT